MPDERQRAAQVGGVIELDAPTLVYAMHRSG
jgi:hypothetical protein